jgi:hypothetical protein
MFLIHKDPSVIEPHFKKIDMFRDLITKKIELTDKARLCFCSTAPRAKNCPVSKQCWAMSLTNRQAGFVSEKNEIDYLISSVF